MASGTITFSASGYLQGKIDWSSSSNGSVANTSTVTAKLYAKRTNGYTTKGQSWSGYVKVGSTQTNISFSSSVSVSSSWVLMATVTATVSHNDNGSGTVTISGSVKGPSGTALSGNTSSGSSTVTLDTIPRASVLGTISNFILGNAINIPITKRSSSFTDSLTISLSGTTIKTVSNITNGYDVSFTTAELNTIYSKIPNGTTGTFTFTLTTKSGSTTIGTSVKTATGTIPTSVKPSISSVTVSEGNTSVVPSSWGVYVKNKSKLKFVISASAGTGSSVSSVKTTINGSTYVGTTITTNLINTSGSLTATITVTDKRNRSTSITKTISILDYDDPYITTLNAFRCDADGNMSDKGTYMYVNLKGGIYSLNGKNTPFSYAIQYKKTSEEEYQTYTFESTDTSFDGYVILSDIAGSSSYNVKAVITDYFTSISRSTPPISSVFRTVNYKAGGHGMGIGKLAEEEDLLDIAFVTRFRGGIQNEVLENGTDLDDIKLSNTYTLLSANTYVNSPTSDGASLEVMGNNETTITQRITTRLKTGSKIYERHFYSGAWGEWQTISEDTGWVDLELVNGCTNVNWHPLRARKKNGIVTIQGFVNIPSVSWDKQIAIIPEGFRPSNEIDTICRSAEGEDRAYIIAFNKDGRLCYLDGVNPDVTNTNIRVLIFATYITD